MSPRGRPGASRPARPASPGSPKKSLGQHFLRSQAHLRMIVQALEPVPGELVVEVGAGRGALTEHLLAAGLRVVALEIDPDLLAGLRSRLAGKERLALAAGDARTADYAAFGESFKVAGNLPYQSAGPITARLMEYADRIPVMVLMYQREVARRVAASPGSRAWGYLSCLVQYHCHAEYLETIPPGAFWPPPKVHSGLVRLRAHPAPALSPPEKKELFEVIGAAFSHRRKTLLNALSGSPWGTVGKDRLRELLEGWGIDAGRRPETFTLDEFVLLRKILARESRRPEQGRPAGGGRGQS